MEITILPSAKIDKKKWDDCVQQNQAVIYATSTYLDCMTDNWSGITAEDYEIVMPVAWRKKLKIVYCYKVPFIQQLGIFGKEITEEIVQQFLEKFHNCYKYGDYSFNYINKIDDAATAKNYVLSLANKHSTIQQFYSSNCIRNLSKANDNNLMYEEGTADETINMFMQLYHKRMPHVQLKDYENFKRLCVFKAEEKNIFIRKVVKDKEVVAAIILLKNKLRMYAVMPVITEAGRQLNAGHFLFDSVIKEFAQTGMTFDFEGSEIAGVENFYKGFGAFNQPYPTIHFNHLPKLLQFFKR